MKKIITILFISANLVSFAQPKLLTQAIVSTKTTIIAPDDEEATSNSTGPNGEEIRMMRFGGDGETKTTTWLKNDLIKTFSETDMGRTTAIRDNSKKLTTTVMEIMGRKMGFFATDEDQLQMQKQMDSMMKSRNQNDLQNVNSGAPTIGITYVDETKKIAGFECKKAFVIVTRGTKKPDTTTCWYIPDLKLNGLSFTGGSLGGFGGMTTQAGANGLDQLSGFPMQYERVMNRGRKMTVQVTKLVTDKEITDKEFEIPKDVDIKPMKDMQNGGRPGMQIRIGG